MSGDFYDDVDYHQTHFFTSFESFQWCMQHHAACYARHKRFSGEWHDALRNFLSSKKLSTPCHIYLQHYERITGDVLPLSVLADNPSYNDCPSQYSRFLTRFREHILNPMKGYPLLKEALRCQDGHEERVSENPLWDVIITEVRQMPLPEKIIGLLLMYQLGVHNLPSKSLAMTNIMNTWNSFIASCTIHQQHAWVHFVEEYTVHKRLVLFLKEALPLGYQADYATWPDDEDIVHYHAMGRLIEVFELDKRYAGVHLYQRYDEIGAMKVCAFWHMAPNAKVLGLSTKWVTMLGADGESYHNRTLTVDALWRYVQQDFPPREEVSIHELPLY